MVSKPFTWAMMVKFHNIIPGCEVTCGHMATNFLAQVMACCLTALLGHDFHNLTLPSPTTDYKDEWMSRWDLRLYSLERRRERYLIIYVWRILEAQVPNPSGKYAITANTHPREAENVSFRKSATLLHGGFRHCDMPVCLYEVPGSPTSCLPTSGTSQGAQWMFSRVSWTNFYWLSQMSPKSQATLLRGGQNQIASLIWPVMPIPGIGWKCWMVTPQQWRLRYQRCRDIVVSKDLTR